MHFADFVTIEVGAAIAKSILQLWLKNLPILPDASSSIIDILKSQISNTADQRQASREIEAIGDKIGKNLLPFFKKENVNSDDYNRLAVAQAVAETFNNACISSKILAEFDLDSNKLKNYLIQEFSNTTKLFNETEKSLYERILSESCKYIVDIASQLPSFAEDMFAEVFKREGQLLTKVDIILQEIQKMSEQLNPTVEAERFEGDYRWVVARNLDIIQLFGADVSIVSRRHRLSIAYVTLSVEQRGTSYPVVSTPKLIKAEDRKSLFKKTIMSADKALSSSNRLLIRGLPGSGKTTLLQWIAVKSASRSFDEPLLNWNNALPFYIRLRQFAKSELPSPETFSKLTASTIADAMPKGWVHSVLSSGRGIVLIDGLDEIPNTRREDVYTWLKGLINTFPLSCFIITSRPHAVKNDWLDNEGFDVAELQPMELNDIHIFINHWHDAVRGELSSEEEKMELAPLAEHLKEEVEHRRSIRNLATSPLLCAMLCALNRDRSKQIPSIGIELYEILLLFINRTP